MSAVTIEAILFWVFAVAIVSSAVMVIAARNPISSAMSLVACFFFLAGIYVLLWAHTIAVLQVLVYAGAIMVLFLFVIMLLSLPENMPRSKLTLSRLIGGVASFGLMAALVAALSKLPNRDVQFGDAQVQSFGSIQKLGEVLYTQYLLPFEAVSLLLLVAIVGAVVVAKSRI